MEVKSQKEKSVTPIARILRKAEVGDEVSPTFFPRSHYEEGKGTFVDIKDGIYYGSGFALASDPATFVMMPDGAKIEFAEKTIWRFDAGGCVDLYEGPPGLITVEINSSDGCLSVRMENWPYTEIDKGTGRVIYIPPEPV